MHLAIIYEVKKYLKICIHLAIIYKVKRYHMRIHDPPSGYIYSKEIVKYL